MVFGTLLRKPGRFLTTLLFSSLLAVLLAAPGARAAQFPEVLDGAWFEAPPDWVYGKTPALDERALKRVPQVTLTGGRTFHVAEFELTQPEDLVVDFKNTQTIGRFHHWIFDARGALLGEAQGGMLSDAPNPFFLTHGREFRLPAGRYRLVTEIASPFYIAQPQPYLDTAAHYRQATKLPAALGVFCLGILFGLGIYYFTLAFARRNLAEAMYAAFIAGNLLFDSASLLVLHEIAGIHSFALLGLPLLFSNAIYIVFVMALLNIRRGNYPRLHRIGLVLLGVLGVMAVLAFAMPHWALELERKGVALFLLFGIIAGVASVRGGNMTARFYLAAVSLFCVVGGITITASKLGGIYTLHVEHLGVLAVTAEVLALALVLSYQFAQMRSEKDTALSLHATSMRQARTDSLTGLPNRLALEEDLAPVPPKTTLTFIDMDGLKHYNDLYGHDRGDDLLRSFAGELRTVLDGRGRLYRLGGDEFAIICLHEDANCVVKAINEAIAATRAQGFEETRASFGTAHAHEADGREKLMHIADTRMYAHKHGNREEDKA